MVQHEMTLSNALDELGWGPFHWRLMIQCGLSWACDAIEIMFLSFLIPNVIGSVFLVDADAEVKDVYSFLLGAVTFLGILVGNLLFGVLSDVYGRRTCYFTSTGIIALFGLLCAASTNIQTLIALRAIVGFGLGGITCSFTLMSEMIGQAHRGKKLILSMGFMWTGGCIFVAIMAWIAFTLLPPEWQWKAFVIFAAIPSLSLLFLFPWMVESPRYHLRKGQEEKAVATLRLAALKNKVDLPEDLKLQAQSQEDKSSNNNRWQKWLTIFSRKYCLTTVLLLLLWFLNMGSYYGICFVTPLYFKALHDNEYLAAFISALSEIPGLLLSSWLLDKIGRKKTLLVLYTICGISTVILGLDHYLPFPVLVIAAVFSRGSADAGVMSLWTYTPEIYPTEVRNLALGLGSGVSRIAGMLVSYISFRSANLANADTAVFIYAGAAAACLVLSFFLPIETKGRPLDSQDDQDKSEKAKEVL